MGKLSIYIPTWNRPHLLDRLLQSIEPQLTDGVNVYVSINKCDATYNLPSWVQSRYTRINVGGDANIIPGPTLVNGEYVWVIGDDEQLKPNAIQATLRAIEEKPGLIIHPDGQFDFRVPLGTTFPNYKAFCEKMISFKKAAIITAHTLISSNTFIREAYDPAIAIQRIDTRYGFHYGMLQNLFDKPVKIADQPTMTYDHQASIFMHDEAAIAEHMAAYPHVIYDIFDWITDRTGVEIPRGAYKRGFV